MTKAKSAAPDMRELTVVYRDPASLTDYENNSRTHSPEQIEKLRASIREFGFTNPILLKNDDTTIGAGHARNMAALAEGLDRVPTITLHGLSDAQWRAYVIADNQLALTGSGWDEDALRSELDALTALDFSINVIGFDEGELLSIYLPKEDGPTDADEHWVGMPEFDSSPPCFRKLVVNFDSAEDVADFARVVGQDFSDKAKYIWHPSKERRDLEGQRWVEGEIDAIEKP